MGLFLVFVYRLDNYNKITCKIQMLPSITLVFTEMHIYLVNVLWIMDLFLMLL